MFFRFLSLPAFVWGNMTSSSHFVKCYITRAFRRAPRISLFPFQGEGEGVGWWTLARWAWKPERCLAVKRHIQYTVAASFCSRHLEIRQKCACTNVASSSIGEPWQIPSTSCSSQRLFFFFLPQTCSFTSSFICCFPHSLHILKPNLYRYSSSSKQGGVTFTYVNVGS